MFGALNRFIGKLDAESPPEQSPSNGGGESPYGFQVLRNPNLELPLEPWFDFIIGINGHLIDDPDPNLFSAEVRNCAGSSVSLDLWSAKGQRTHTVVVPIDESKPSLGVTLQLAPLASTENIWHVLSIPSPQSPAYLAGLLPHSDYILGTPSGTLRGDSALGELVEDHLNRSLTLWVYNSEFDVVRDVEIAPSRNWGGEGALGAELGYGALHRLPVGLGEEVEGPGEVVFETKEGVETERKQAGENSGGAGAGGAGGAATTTQPPSQGDQRHYLVPANMQSPPALSSDQQQQQQQPPKPTAAQGSPSPVRHGRKPRHAHPPAGPSFDDYFRESEQKSKEQDFVPSGTGSPVPPPPKASHAPEAETSPKEEEEEEEEEEGT